jgi:hypothetical protein
MKDPTFSEASRLEPQSLADHVQAVIKSHQARDVLRGIAEVGSMGLRIHRIIDRIDYIAALYPEFTPWYENKIVQLNRLIEDAKTLDMRTEDLLAVNQDGSVKEYAGPRNLVGEKNVFNQAVQEFLNKTELAIHGLLGQDHENSTKQGKDVKRLNARDALLSIPLYENIISRFGMLSRNIHLYHDTTNDDFHTLLADLVACEEAFLTENITASDLQRIMEKLSNIEVAERKQRIMLKKDATG